MAHLSKDHKEEVWEGGGGGSDTQKQRPQGKTRGGGGGTGVGGGAHISIDDKQRPGRRGGCGG